MPIFFLIFLSINFFNKRPLSYKQTLAKTGFEISVQFSYLKKLGTKNAEGERVGVTEKYCFISSTIKY